MSGPDPVAEIVAGIIERGASADRFIVAVAGPPGAGKSTLAARLVELLPRGEAALLQGDGFHYDNALLDRLGRRAKKGAPDTFDCRGLEVTLQRLRQREDSVVVPAFDRELDVAKAGVARIDRSIRYIVCEGNYLLVDQDPWRRLAPLFDLTVMIETPRAELERRLVDRWLSHGHTKAEALARAQSNDLPNADFVIAHSRAAHRTIVQQAAIRK